MGNWKNQSLTSRFGKQPMATSSGLGPLLGAATLVVACVVAGCSVPPPKEVAGTLVTTDSGRVTGVSSNERVVRWLDIPYAQPPVGDFRWRAPRKLDNSDQTIVAKTHDVLCMQMPGAATNTEGEVPIGSEDCLYLDVSAPRDFAGKRYPVMFWIHGGGNTTGTKDTYDFSELVEREQVVVVTINYRLGPLGWFTHPSLRDDAAELDRSPNFGTLDMITALQWTQRNIAQFGGDAENVTIFGESAGGHNVFALLASPLTEDLFHKAISQSGYVTTVNTRQAFNQDREFTQIDRGGWEVVKALNLDPVQVTAEELRRVDAGRLLSVYNALEKDHLAPLTTADDIVIPEQGILAALAEPNHASNIPVMAGANRDEVTLWLGLNRYFVQGEDVLFGLLPPKLSVRDTQKYRHWIDLRSRAWRARGVDEPLAALHASGNDALYAYRFDWDEQEDIWFFPFSEILGAAHGADIAFVMGAPMYGSIGEYMYPDTDSAAQMTERMMSAWGNFARDGQPGIVDGMPWPEFAPRSPHVMILDSGDAMRVDAKGVYLDELLQEAASPSAPLSSVERCILVWEMLTNIGEPYYGHYQRWNDGECSDIDARAEKLATRLALEAEYGSATLP